MEGRAQRRWGLVKGFSLAAVVAGPLGAGAVAQEMGTVLREQKIAASTGGFAGPLDNEDHFGAALARLGDVDGDGTDDLAVGAPDDDDGGLNRGAVWILFLDTDGTAKGQSKVSDSFGGFLGALDNVDRFGVSLANVGDLDGDGLDELAVGAEQDDDGGSNRGAVWLLFLDRTGHVRLERKISQSAGGFSGVLRNDDRFGRSVAGLGDLDGDGVEDIAVGAHLDDDGGSGRGAVWILFLQADGSVARQVKLSDLQGGFGGLLHNLDNFGVSLARLGDLDGDGVTELGVGADQDDDAGSSSGAAWILFLASDGTVQRETKIGAASIAGLSAFDRFGASLACPGDVDGDRVPDLAASAMWEDDGGLNRGAVWVLFLQPDGTPRAGQKISSTEGNLTGPLANNEFFGAGLAALHDQDGDRKLDLAVGADGDDAGGTNRGAAWVLFLESAPLPGVVVRNGSGLNPLLLGAVGPPATGSDWQVQVDCRGFKGGVVFHVGVDRPASGPIHKQFGEFLIDWRRPRLFRTHAPHRGALLTIVHAIPARPELVGLSFFSQALITGRGGPELTNALDGEFEQGSAEPATAAPKGRSRGWGPPGAQR